MLDALQEKHTDTVERLLEAAARSTTLQFSEGVPPTTLALLGEALGAPLPGELEALYRGGTPQRASAPLRDDAWYFLQPNELAEAQRELCACAPEAAGLVPFLRSGCGDLLCVRWERDPDAEAGAPPREGAVVEVCPRPWLARDRYPSLARWFELTTAGFERGLLEVDDAGGVAPVDPIAWERFLDHGNPGFENDDPPPRAAPTQRLTETLQRVALGVGSLSLIVLVTSAKLHRGRLPRWTFGVFLGGLAVVALTLALAAWSRRRARSALEGAAG
ncbi:MAG: SMI1/KNR4 family protein [Planctomycetes bacterium]|nr:SMI1/KNR4 family protein [Planctomycetota bacterium]